MPFQPESKDWPHESAILLVHGVGNAQPGDYDDLVEEVRGCLGDAADRFAIYRLMYDSINDWFMEKTQFASLLGNALGFLRGKINVAGASDTMAEVIGDVLWPVMSGSARVVLREAYIAQLQQIVLDGIRAGVPAPDQQLHIICHSLGCFHTYEALHAAAGYKKYALRPATDGVRFANVIFMASPVKLIRSAAESISGIIPKRWSATLSDSGLEIPFEIRPATGRKMKSVRRCISITGSLDPVGGHFFREKAEWAYMKLDGQESIIDPQDALNIGSVQELKDLLAASLRERERPEIRINNPHSWMGYVTRHREELKQWIVG